MSTAIVTSDTSEGHITGDGHPEQPKRVSAVIKRLKKRDNLLWIKSEKFDQKILKKVFSPAGLNINAVTPEEIALSIMAEIVQLRRMKKKVAL